MSVVGVIAEEDGSWRQTGNPITAVWGVRPLPLFNGVDAQTQSESHLMDETIDEWAIKSWFKY
ncbi:hypothetical protein K443DRAFT_12681 [Laccaria amethystina LaAM-08-1]|uniref:Uncharacterized protein n=1 Tax=Laccaria amethystina LaAM-08-1 TaxID=1095629 RepID=A0A0C9WQY9_9AGAR|nr:hypothetical protein K443DRAFT_12681 [Laccaria amethystina LaAM-08-1]